MTQHSILRCVAGLGAVLALSASLTAQTAWSRIVVPGREGAAMALHAASGNVVLFGGSDVTGTSLNDTWEWNGARWEEVVPTTRPVSRKGARMAHDATRGKTVMFGGDAGVLLGDTWEWDGTDWTPRPVQVSPPARVDHAMAFDAARGRILLFGGNGSGGPLGDTWEYDGTTWTLLAPTGSPSPRAGHAMAYDPTRRRVILFGGRDAGGQVLGDTWTWNGMSWSQANPQFSPPPSEYHAMAFEGGRGEVVLFGGRNQNAVGIGESYFWNGNDWTGYIASFGPKARYGHSMALEPVSGRVIMFGGVMQSGAPSSETWFWDPSFDSWGVGGGSPAAAAGHALAYDSARDRVALFGGEPGNFFSPFQSDLWELDPDGWNAPLSFVRPLERRDGAMAYDAQRGEVVLFGGQGVVNTVLSSLGDTWTWDGSQWTEDPGLGPLARVGHAMTYDAARSRVVMFGGADMLGGAALQDTWLWDGSSWTNVNTATSPSARMGHAMDYDAARKRTVLFGGADANGANLVGDTWEWDGTNWSLRLAAGGPSARRDHAMAFDPRRERSLLFGGRDGGGFPQSDTWEWDGAIWNQLAPLLSPFPRWDHAMAWGGSRKAVVLYGGETLGALPGPPYLDDTWAFEVGAPADFATFGAGCAGSLGVPALAAAEFGLPWIGDSLVLELGNVPLGAIPVIVVGASDTIWNGVPLPLALDPIGLVGCALLVSNLATAPMAVAGTDASIGLPIPPQPVLIGAELFAQGLVVLAGSANTPDIAFSNGGKATIGSRY